MKAKRKYSQIKKEYLKLFKRVDKFLKDQPDAVLEFDEMSEPEPTLGFAYRKGKIKTSVTFELTQKKEVKK